MNLIDTTDGVIQSDSQSNNDSTEDDYSDSNEASDEDGEDDVRSSSLQSVRRRRSPSPEEPKSSEVAYSHVVETTEVARDAPEEDPKDVFWDTSASRKKGHKNSKSKISEKRAFFES